MPLNPVQPAPAALAQPESTPSETISTIHPVDTSQLADTLEATLGSAQASAQTNEPASEGAVVEGIVRNQSGTPVAGATIHIAEKPTQDTVLGKPPVARTGTDGRFRVTHVNPEVRTVFADHPDYAPGWSGIKPNSDATVQVEILLTQGGAIEGVVTSGGEPQANAFVGAWLDASGENAQTDEEGRYRIERVPMGEWIVVLILKDTDGVQREARQSVLVSNGMVTNVDFNVPPPVTDLTGTITVRGEPVEGGDASLLVSTPQGLKEQRRVSLNDDGKYLVQRVPEGPAELAIHAITHNHRHYFRTARFEITANVPNVRDIDITPGTGVVSGAVKLDKPATSGYIMLLEGEFDPVDMSREAFLYVDSRRVAMSPQVDRSYRFDEIEPGTYTLLALIYPDESEISNTADPLSNALIDLQPVVLADGEERTIDLHPTRVP